MTTTNPIGSLPSATKRANIRVTGRVGHGCYLGFIDEWAFALDLRGAARATGPDSVEIVCEGPVPRIKDLVGKLQIKVYPVRVDAIDVGWTAATGEFTDFIISMEGLRIDSVYFFQKASFLSGSRGIRPQYTPQDQPLWLLSNNPQ